MNTLAFVAALTALGSGAAFQATPTPLDSLISIALSENSALRASRERVIKQIVRSAITEGAA